MISFYNSNDQINVTGNKSSEVLKGTHGTSQSRAKAIKAGKFKPSKNGYLGDGVYFWAYENNNKFANYLAESWWTLQKHKFNAYQTDEDQSLAILDAEILHPGNEYLDVSSEDFLGLFAEFAEKRKVERNKEKINHLKTVVIQEIEKDKDIKYSVIKLLVDTPPKPPGGVMPYVYGITKSVSCYVVKRNYDELIKKVDITS